MMNITLQQRRFILALCQQSMDANTDLILKETAGDSGPLLLAVLMDMAKHSNSYEELATEFFKYTAFACVSPIAKEHNSEDSYPAGTLLVNIIDSHSWAFVAKKVLADSALINKKNKATGEALLSMLTIALEHLENKKKKTSPESQEEPSSQRYKYLFSDKGQVQFDEHINQFLCELFLATPEAFWLLYDFCKLLDAIEQGDNNVPRKAVTVYTAPSVAQALDIKGKISKDLAHESHFIPMVLDSILKAMKPELNRLEFIKHMSSQGITETSPKSRKGLRSRSRSQDKHSPQPDLTDALTKATEELSKLEIESPSIETSPKSVHKIKYSSPQPKRKEKKTLHRALSVPSGLHFKPGRKPQ